MLLSLGLMAEGLTLRSETLQGQLSLNEVFNGFGCTGKNISPELSWAGAPKGTKSFAVTVYDKDAPTGSGWWHWLVINISKDTHAIKQGTAPKGALETLTDFGKSGFGGACPPEGDKAHAYTFTVFALDVEHLDLKENSSPALVGYMLNAHAIEKASLISYYKR